VTLEIFALLTTDGDQAQADHILTGKMNDIEGVATVLDAAFANNRRMRSIAALAGRFHEAAQAPVPVVRLSKQECRCLVEAVSGFAEGMPKKSKARKLSDHLDAALCVY